jgi:hypothetical protein
MSRSGSRWRSLWAEVGPGVSSSRGDDRTPMRPRFDRILTPASALYIIGQMQSKRGRAWAQRRLSWRCDARSSLSVGDGPQSMSEQGPAPSSAGALTLRDRVAHVSGAPGGGESFVLSPGAHSVATAGGVHFAGGAEIGSFRSGKYQRAHPGSLRVAADAAARTPLSRPFEIPPDQSAGVRVGPVCSRARTP